MTEIFSDTPLWTLIVWAVIVVSLSLFLYRKKSWVKEISQLRRITLISLRSLGLFLLGILLLGILIKGVDKEIDKPIIISIVDDSESMLNYADSASVKELTKEYLNTANLKFKERYNHLTFSLSDEIKDVDSLCFKNNRTNISHALNKVYDNYYGRNIGAIILLSDGNFNAGTTPLLITEKFKRTPIYTLSVGDTIQKVDHLIKSVINNEIAFLNNKFPVEVTIEGNKTPDKAFKLELLKDGRVIETQSLKHQNDDYSLIKATFHLEAKQVGMHEYTVKIEHLSNEFNFENNEKSFFIEVLDDRSKVLLVAEALNPDAGAVKSALISEQNIEVKTVSVNELPTSLEEYDLIVWLDPGVNKNPNDFKKLTDYKKAIWYFITPQTSRTAISSLQLQASINTTGRTDNVGAAFNQAFNLFKLSPETRKTIDQFPPLKSHYGSIKYNNSSSTLAFQKVGNIAKNEPLFYFGMRDKNKFAVTYGAGFWSWRLADYQINQSHNSFNELVRKTVQYLILKENTSRLRINLPSIANSEDEFIINGLFYNESYEPITEPSIHLELKKPNGEKFEYVFLPMEEEYHLNLGRLASGRYSWRAFTSYNNKDFAKEGSFAIKDLALEKQATKANHQLLQQIADNKNGKFEMLSDFQTVIDDIAQRDDIVPVAYESSSYKKLIDYFWLLIAIVFVFTTEWIMRRYLGAY